MDKRTIRLIILFTLVMIGAIALLGAGRLQDEQPGETTSTDEVVDEVTNTEPETIKEMTDNYEITAQYPVVGNQAAVIEGYVREQVETFRQNVADAAAAGGIMRQHILNINFETYETEDFASYAVTQYLYRGGANGIQLIETFVFTESGNKVELVEIVPEGRQAELVSAVKAQIREVNSIPAGEPLPFQNEITFADFNHFYLTEAQLVIAFNEYTVAPGAAGVVRIKVPAESYVRTKLDDTIN